VPVLVPGGVLLLQVFGGEGSLLRVDPREFIVGLGLTSLATLASHHGGPRECKGQCVDDTQDDLTRLDLADGIDTPKVALCVEDHHIRDIVFVAAVGAHAGGGGEVRR